MSSGVPAQIEALEDRTLLSAAPVADITGPTSINEGEGLSLSASGSWDPDGHPLSFSWDINGDGVFGDFTGESLWLSESDLQMWGLNDDGTYTIGVEVSDGVDGTDTASLDVTVNNIAPTIDSFNLSGGPAWPGDTVSLNASFTDPGTADTFSYIIDWGDGNTDTGNPGSGTIDASHVYSTPGSYTVTLTVSDDDGGEGAWTEGLTVDSIAPTISGSSTTSEGDSYSLDLSAAGPVDSWTIDWGDGTIEAGVSSGWTSHVYIDEGSTGDYTITVTAHYQGSDYVADPLTVTVNNIAPVIDSAWLSGSPGYPGDTVSLNASFTDPGTADTFSYVIDWGDGTTDTGTPGSGTIDASHVYTTPGSYTVTLTVSDDDGGEGTWAEGLTIDSIGPTISGSSTTSEGDSYSLDLTAAGPVDSWTINWGDGTIDTGVSSGWASHTYIDEGSSGSPTGDYTITVTAHYQGSDYTADPLTVTVNNIAPVIDSAWLSGSSGYPGDTVSLNASFTDPGTADTFSYVIDWGDGTTDNGNPGSGMVDASHIYSTPGSYTVTLTVSDDDTGEGMWSQVVDVVNTAPMVMDDNYSIVHDTTLDVPADGVLANDSDAENQPLTATLNTGPAHAASFVLNPDGSFTYVPETGWSGTDSFTYTVSDGFESSAAATVTIEVTNDAAEVTQLAFNEQGRDPWYGAFGYLEGTITDDGPPSGGDYSLEIDIDGDGVSDYSATVSDSTFSVPISELPFDEYDIYVRAIEELPDGTPLAGDWASVHVNLTPPANDAPQVANLTFTITSHGEGAATGELTGDIIDDHVDGGQFELQVDVGNDGTIDSTQYAGSAATTLWDELDLEYGTVEVAVRVIEYESGRTLEGNWVTASFNVDPPFNDAPTVTNLAYTGLPELATGSTEVAGYISGEIGDATPSPGGYFVELDTDGDGVSDASGTLAPGEVDFEFSVAAEPGNYTWSVRVTETDAYTGETLQSAWTDLSFVVPPADNSRPALAELSFTEDTGGGYLQGEVFDATPLQLPYFLEVDVNDDGVADEIISLGTVPTAFNVWLDLPTIPDFVDARVVEGDGSPGTLYGDWERVNIDPLLGDDSNQAPEFEESSYEFTMSSLSLEPGETVGTVTATDPDLGDNLTYVLAPVTRPPDAPPAIFGPASPDRDGLQINSETGEITVKNVETLRSILGTQYKYTATVWVSDGNLVDFVEVTVYEDYQPHLQKIENSITAWKSNIDYWNNKSFDNSLEALAKYDAFVSEAIDEFEGASAAITNLSWAGAGYLAPPVAGHAAVAAVTIQLMINAAATHWQNGHDATVAEIKRLMEEVLDQDKQNVLTLQSEMHDGLTQLIADISNKSPDEKTRMVIEYGTAPGWPDESPAVDDIYAELLIQHVRDAGWTMYGSTWQMVNFGSYWNAESVDWPGLSVNDFRDELNRLGYTKGDRYYINQP